MSNKKYGLDKERKLKSKLELEGALFVSRCRGSFGVFDLICFHNSECMLISVKATHKIKYNAKPELRKLYDVVVPNYCKKYLYVWSNKKWKIYKIDSL